AKVPKLRMDCTIRIGRPIKVERYQDRADDRMVLRQITDEVMFEIRELTGQDYRDVYATKKADGIPTDTARVAHVDDAAASREPELVSARRGESGLAGAGAPGRFARAMSEIRITLPDGSERAYPEGATGADVATSIGPRLAKAAVA